MKEKLHDAWNGAVAHRPGDISPKEPEGEGGESDASVGEGSYLPFSTSGGRGRSRGGSGLAHGESLAIDSCATATKEFFDFGEGGHRSIARSGHSERSVGGAVFDRLLWVSEF